jgi:hypothetical protein
MAGIAFDFDDAESAIHMASKRCNSLPYMELRALVVGGQLSV